MLLYGSLYDSSEGSERMTTFSVQTSWANALQAQCSFRGLLTPVILILTFRAQT